MATIDTSWKGKAALELARELLLEAVPAVPGESAEQRLSQLAHAPVSENAGAIYVLLLDKAERARAVPQ